MFKEENIELISKIFCFIIFILVISFLSNVFSLLLLFVVFFLIGKKEDTAFFSILSVLSLLGLASAFIANSFWLLKFFLIIDYGYYFFHFFKVNKHFWVVEKKVDDDKYVDDQKINEIEKELKKGKVLKQEDIDLIKSHLDEKEVVVKKEQDDIKYLRFNGYKNTSLKWRFNFDDINGIYVICHLVILILAIVVE